MNPRETATPPPRMTPIHQRCTKHEALVQKIDHCKEEILQERQERVAALQGMSTDLKDIKSEVTKINVRFAKWGGAIAVVLVLTQLAGAWLIRVLS